MGDSVLSRVSREKEELDKKLEALRAFLKSEAFLDETNVSNLQAKLLIKQKNTMENYSDILGARIDDLDEQIEVVEDNEAPTLSN